MIFKLVSGLTSQWMVCRGAIDDVLLCSECGEEVEKASVSEHCIKSHPGQQCSTVQEFSWVVLRIGKLHLEMDMARHSIDLNWDIFLSKLASELGFVSENARPRSICERVLIIIRQCR